MKAIRHCPVCKGELKKIPPGKYYCEKCQAAFYITVSFRVNSNTLKEEADE